MRIEGLKARPMIVCGAGLQPFWNDNWYIPFLGRCPRLVWNAPLALC